ncbi:MAG TPA: hypothetical protein VJG32_06085 [Anaerolineae bacterium]|nr:hypothetical protein [Anaerolineae bacterium]
MDRKKLYRWLRIGLLAAALGLPIMRVAADVSAALDEGLKSSQQYDLHDKVADPTTGGGSGGGGGG